MALQRKAVAPAPAGFMFGDLSQYSSGGGIPEGDYCWTDLTVEMFQPTKQTGEKVGPTVVALGYTTPGAVLGHISEIKPRCCWGYCLSL